MVEVVSLQCDELGMAPFPMTPWVTCRSLAEARHIIVSSGALNTPLCVLSICRAPICRTYFSGTYSRMGRDFLLYL